MKKLSNYILDYIFIFYDWIKYGHFREMSKAEALIVLFGRKSFK